MMAAWQGTVSRRRFLGLLGGLTLGTAGLAACGTTTTAPAAATSAPTATTVSATIPPATATSAPAVAAAPAATATSATTAATSGPTATSATTAATSATTRTSTTAAATSGGEEGDVPNGTYGGSKFFSVVTAQKVEVAAVVGALKWDKAQYTATAGDVTFVVKNPATFPHQFGVEGNGIMYESGNLGPNTTTNLTIKGLKAGEYDIVCNVPGHKAAGMVAKLSVA